MRAGCRFYVQACVGVAPLVLALLLLNPKCGEAIEISEDDLSYQAERGEGLIFLPVTLPDGGHVTLISPSRWRSLLKRLERLLVGEHARFTSLLGPLPPVKTAVQLMEEEHFFKLTQAPKWTNALYYQGRITVPLSPHKPVDCENLMRAIKHEFAHAIVNAISGGHCPGWLDEGLAQWAEGSENPALRPALERWLHIHAPVSLEQLQGGFTRLESSMVPAAYAQSLYLTKLIIKSFGFQAIRNYLDDLRGFGDRALAFQNNFGINEQNFERMAALALSRWSAQ